METSEQRWNKCLANNSCGGVGETQSPELGLQEYCGEVPEVGMDPFNGKACTQALVKIPHVTWFFLSQDVSFEDGEAGGWKWRCSRVLWLTPVLKVKLCDEALISLSFLLVSARWAPLLKEHSFLAPRAKPQIISFCTFLQNKLELIGIQALIRHLEKYWETHSSISLLPEGNLRLNSHRLRNGTV